MNIDIKHKHSGHLIVIEGKPFKANDSGQWDLTEVWQTLELPKGKAPGKFMDRKEAKRLEGTEKIGFVKVNRVTRTLAAKQAVIRYAAWVSPEFEDAVFDAFEAILESPEVAALVIKQMNDLGHTHSAAIVEKTIFNDRCDWKAFRRRTPRKLSADQKMIQKANRQANHAATKARKMGKEDH